ncbi:MAG: cupin domain-containing protein [Solirubrobacteraceae bacterium]
MATVVSGEVTLVLEAGDVVLRAGDSLILPGSVHAWRNVTDSPTTIVTTVFALADSDGG